MKRGIDVSAYQGDIDWRRVKASGIEWAMVKCSQAGYTAENFDKNIRGANAVGIPCGVYHFLTAANAIQAKAEIEGLLARLEPYRDQIQLYVCLDVESSKLPKDKGTLTDLVRGMYNMLERSGYRAIVYTNPNWLRTRLNDISDLRLWLAWWRRKDQVPSLADYPNMRLWQWGTETVDGIFGSVDGNLMIVEEPCSATAPEPASPWAADAWERACVREIFDGTRPQEPLTREQAALVLARLGLV